MYGENTYYILDKDPGRRILQRTSSRSDLANAHPKVGGSGFEVAQVGGSYPGSRLEGRALWARSGADGPGGLSEAMRIPGVVGAANQRAGRCSCEREVGKKTALTRDSKRRILVLVC